MPGAITASIGRIQQLTTYRMNRGVTCNWKLPSISATSDLLIFLLPPFCSALLNWISLLNSLRLLYWMNETFVFVSGKIFSPLISEFKNLTYHAINSVDRSASCPGGRWAFGSRGKPSVAFNFPTQSTRIPLQYYSPNWSTLSTVEPVHYLSL